MIEVQKCAYCGGGNINSIPEEYTDVELKCAHCGKQIERVKVENNETI